jgi:hypothetical protein
MAASHERINNFPMNYTTTLIGRSVMMVAVVACACTPAVKTSSTPGPVTVSSTITASEEGTIRLADAPSIATTEIAAPIDSVWRVLPAVYTKLEIAPEITDRGVSVFGTRAHTSSRLGGKRTMDFLRCPNSGVGPSGAVFRTRITILTTVAELPERKTAVSTEVAGTATSIEGTSTGAVKCASTGEIERRIVGLIGEFLRLAQ